MYSLETLQFVDLLRLVSENAQTPMGIDRFAALEPYTSQLELRHELTLLTEMIALSGEDISWTFSEIPDLENQIAVLKIRNSSLEPLTIRDFGRVISQALLARGAIGERKDLAPTIWETVESIPVNLKSIADSIDRTILPSGELNDAASSELARIRRELNEQRGRVTKMLEAVMRAKSDAVQDEIVTVRNGRFVIPVKSDFGGKIKGVAHGASSSGATLFIEPLDSIDANNELQKLKAREDAEIARILFSLSDSLRENLPGIESAFDAIGRLDFVKAKMLFARKFDAVVPEIAVGNVLDLEAARHPLLEENLRGIEAEIVPVSIHLNHTQSVMIISGANAGGKTVVLKTAGLLSLMAISGIPVPARKARVPFYAAVLADIGDHQSLSANLSTFSSHVSNIAEMMRELHPPALVLLDEVGTGTDPDEGSALGVAIVDYFRKHGAQVIASTHYKGLKIYAANDSDVINASVEFDERTLVPTYNLLHGMAGSSSGLEIARRFGITDEVITQARENLDSASRESESYLQKLLIETRQAEDLRTALEEEREATAQKFAALDIEFRNRERIRKRDFDSSLGKTIDDFERKAKSFLKSIEDKKERKKLEKELLANKAELKRQAFERISDYELESEPPQVEGTQRITKEGSERTQRIKAASAPIRSGMQVVIKSLRSIGKVEKVEGNRAEILVGSMRMRRPLDDLEAADMKFVDVNRKKPASKHKNAEFDLEDRSSPEVETELNLIGMPAIDAQMEVDRFLELSYAASIPRVRIIHGFGTGTLRNAVQQILKRNPNVSSFGFAPQNEGGHGATIVELKGEK